MPPRSLPEDFQKIPLEHPRSRVLASVPGTQQAAEAVLLAQVPETARVNRNEVKAPDVAYQGEPKFESIEKTTVQRAVNTDKDVIKIGDLYYMCFEGIWFLSKSPTGPWEVATSVPKEIYEIPTSSPAHHVTYVTVVEDDDDGDEWVQFATVAAFTGVMIAWGCAVWGTGYYHPPYWGWGPRYPYYFPHYPSYGYGGWYNPWTGGYGRRAVAYGPYGGAGVSARYNPRTGTYARGAAAWGPYGARGVGEAWNPRDGDLCPHPAGIQRLRELGLHGGAAGRPVGGHRSRHGPLHRDHDPCDPDLGGRGGRNPPRPQRLRRRRPHRRGRPLRRP